MKRRAIIKKIVSVVHALSFGLLLPVWVAGALGEIMGYGNVDRMMASMGISHWMRWSYIIGGSVLILAFGTFYIKNRMD